MLDLIIKMDPIEEMIAEIENEGLGMDPEERKAWLRAMQMVDWCGFTFTALSDLNQRLLFAARRSVPRSCLKYPRNFTAELFQGLFFH